MKIKILIFLGVSIIAYWYFTKNETIGDHYEIINKMGSKHLVYDLGSNSSIGRIRCLDKVGFKNQYIFGESKNQYYWFDKSKDNRYFNSDEIVNGPISKIEFYRLLDSLSIKDFEFQYIYK